MGINTKKIKVGNIFIGGSNDVIIQSMTNTKTSDVEATVSQILALETAGCELVRVTVNDMAAAKAIKEIKNCKSQTIMLGLTSLLGSISIVGQAWYFANLINNFIFHEATLESETDNIIGLAVFVILRLIFHYLQEKEDSESHTRRY